MHDVEVAFCFAWNEEKRKIINFNSIVTRKTRIDLEFTSALAYPNILLTLSLKLSLESQWKRKEAVGCGYSMAFIMAFISAKRQLAILRYPLRGSRRGFLSELFQNRPKLTLSVFFKYRYRV